MDDKLRLGAGQDQADVDSWLRFTPTLLLAGDAKRTEAYPWRLDQGWLVLRLYRGESRLPCELSRDRQQLTVTFSGKSLVLRRQPKYPKEFELEPLPPPRVAPAPAEVVQAAQELVKRAQARRDLGAALAKVSEGKQDAATLAKPEVAALVARLEAARVENHKFLSNLALKCGWPTIAGFGRDAAVAAGALALDCPHLRLARTAAAAVETEWKAGGIIELAYAQLADQAHLLAQEPLEYGTRATNGTDGKPLLPIIKDRAKVNANRQRIGQPPIEDLEGRGYVVLELGD